MTALNGSHKIMFERKSSNNFCLGLGSVTNAMAKDCFGNLCHWTKTSEIDIGNDPGPRL